MENYEQDLNLRTRDIYHKQHTRMLNDETTRQRIMNIRVDEEFFNLEKGYFKNKKVLDAGCGSIVRNSIAYAQLGAHNVTALDLGNEWFDTAKENMKLHNMDDSLIKLVSGSVDQLPFEDESFDFVSCDGVLTHLAHEEQVKKAVKELCRVTKNGGQLFISFMAGGGLIESKLSDASKEFYQENKLFKEFIDNIQVEDLYKFVDFITETMEKHDKKINKTFVDYFKSLLDEDFCIGLQNTIQSDTREMHSLEFVNEILQENGFSKIQRLKRYIQRNNIRKFFSPLHFYSDNDYSKILYGDGWIDGITTKIK